MKHLKPDRKGFRELILRKRIPSRVHFVELHIDTEVIRYFTEKEFDQKWIEPSLTKDRKSREVAIKNYIECWYRLGYDCLRFTSDFRFSGSLPFTSKRRLAEDTALLSKEKRGWVEERKGIITSWQDFERYSWPSLSKLDLWPYEFTSQNLPQGMGIFASFSPGIFEILSNELFGLETLSYLLYDKPDLVRATADRVGELIYGAYKKVIGLDNLVGFFQGEDMGFKTATLISPDALKKYILPWHKRFAQLAHDNGLLYILHSCGYIESIMEDLIEDVKIDAKHSFEDAIMPVAEFKRRYGDRISVLGGVDVNKLCQLKEKELRQYIREIIDECMPGGGYALGSGNSITNYIPIENYLIMLEEGAKWGI